MMRIGTPKRFRRSASSGWSAKKASTSHKPRSPSSKAETTGEGSSCSRASLKACASRLGRTARAFQQTAISSPRQERRDDALFAGLVEIDGQFVAVDGADAAVAEFLVKHALATAVGFGGWVGGGDQFGLRFDRGARAEHFTAARLRALPAGRGVAAVERGRGRQIRLAVGQARIAFDDYRVGREFCDEA